VRPFLLRGTLLLGAILASRAGGAQQPNRAPPPVARDSTPPDSAARSVPKLRAIEVRASILPAAGPVVGSGVPARVATLAAAQIDAWEPRTLADAVASLPGFSLYDDLGSAYKLNLSTRGFSAGPTVGIPAGVTVFLDGVRQNEPDAQEVNFDLLPMEHVSHVEVLSGSASLLGPNSLAGAINLVTRRGHGSPSGEVELSGGSFGQRALEGWAGGEIDRWDYYGGVGYERDDGWRVATGATNANLFVNLGQTGEERGFTAQAFAAHSRAATAGSLPESIFGLSPRANFTPGDFEALSAQQLTLSGYRPLGGARTTLTAYLRRSVAERLNVNQPPDASVRNFTGNGTLGLAADWRWSTASRATGHALAIRAGVDVAVNDVHVRIFAKRGDGGADSLTTDVLSPSTELAGYLLADVGIGRVTLSGGARYDEVRVPFRDRLDPTADTTSTFRRLNPRGGISVAIASGIAAYGSIGQSFRAPAVLELACADPDAACPLPFALGDDPPLAPVRVTTYEAGLRWTRGGTLLSGSLYRSEVRDEIFFIASDEARLTGYFTNLPRTRREGGELGAQLFVGTRMEAFANYAYTLATFRDDARLFSVRSEERFAASPLAGTNEVSAGDELSLVPAHQAKAGAVARLPGGVDLALDLRYFGRRWLRGDEANETRPLEPYLVTDARAGVRLREWEIVAIVTNVVNTHAATFGTFNENRRTGVLERFLTPVSGRALKLTLRREIGGGER
jgi:outer membrane receptor protein involved in Fe transport